MSPEPTDPTSEKALLRELGEHLRDHHPDLAHVPRTLVELEHELVTVLEHDDETGETVATSARVVIAPGLFGHAHRLTTQETDDDA